MKTIEATLHQDKSEINYFILHFYSEELRNGRNLLNCTKVHLTVGKGFEQFIF